MFNFKNLLVFAAGVLLPFFLLVFISKLKTHKHESKEFDRENSEKIRKILENLERDDFSDL